MIRSLTLLTMALASPAGAFELAFPADCILGDSCYIQQYADHDPGPAARDFTCGSLSYQGHDGTDIALPSRAAMMAGVDVLAAAPGMVKGSRDGVADFAPHTPGKECGNGVLIDHGNGWLTQYCHMKQGTVAVHSGDTVETGTPLGQIGQSGMAEFPHLHLSLRHDGQTLDPFAPDNPETCGAASDTLWSTPIPYQPGGLLAIGLTTAVPEFDAIKAGLPSPDLPDAAPALVVWVFLYGSQAGDELRMTLAGPPGKVLTEQILLEKPQAQVFRAVGKKRSTETWPAGRYTGTARLIRNGTEISAEEITVTVKP